MPITEICFACGFTKEWTPDTDEKEFSTHNCPGNKLTPIEVMVLGAMNLAEGCDHFCCGLPENACRARTMAQYLKEQGVLGEAPEWFTKMVTDYRNQLASESAPSESSAETSESTPS